MGRLGEQEVVNAIEANHFPARLVTSGLTWVEIEMTPTKGRGRRERISKSTFADLILDWRDHESRARARLTAALREIGVAS